MRLVLIFVCVLLRNTIQDKNTESSNVDIKNIPYMDVNNHTDIKRVLNEVNKKIENPIIIPVDPLNPINTKSIFSSLPENFDWRTTDDGKDCMPDIMNQGLCGSCYAFASTMAFAARYCAAMRKAGKAHSKLALSPQDALSCGFWSKQCDGGNSDQVYKHFETYGVSTEACQPYAEASNTNKEAGEKCLAKTCKDGTPMKKYYCKKGTSSTIYNSDVMKYEIHNWGPITTGMQVMQDFNTYMKNSSVEIYKSQTNVNSGGHLVTLIGWGKDNSSGTEYWIAANSWGADWGLSGYFKIDMSDINSEFAKYAGYCTPDIS